MIYLIKSKKCSKKYVGSTITSFRKPFNNHRSSINRYGRGQRGIPGEQLYRHFIEQRQIGLEELRIQIIGKVDVKDPTNIEVSRLLGIQVGYFYFQRSE